jgi:hypothetical protein
MITVWDYECGHCDIIEERTVQSEEKDKQECNECHNPLQRLISASKLHTITEGTTEHQERMRRRSYEHTMRNVRQGNSLKNNETTRTTCPEWYGKTRSKNARKGLVQENLNLYKKFENLPPVEHRQSTIVKDRK